jgi:hypothetical protein
MSGNTAPCEKCQSEIDRTADRCPQCGYEPGTGIGPAIVGALSVGGVLLFGLLTTASLVAIVSSGDWSLLPGTSVLALFAVGAGAVMRAWMRQSQQTAAGS